MSWLCIGALCNEACYLRVGQYPATENDLAQSVEKGAHTTADTPKTVTVDLSSKMQ